MMHKSMPQQPPDKAATSTLGRIERTANQQTSEIANLFRRYMTIKERLMGSVPKAPSHTTSIPPVSCPECLFNVISGCQDVTATVLNNFNEELTELEQLMGI